MKYLLATLAFLFALQGSSAIQGGTQEIMSKLKLGIDDRDIPAIINLYEMAQPSEAELNMVILPFKMMFKDLDSNWTIKSIDFSTEPPTNLETSTIINGNNYRLSAQPTGKITIILVSNKAARQTISFPIAISEHGSRLVYYKAAEQGAAANP